MRKLIVAAVWVAVVGAWVAVFVYKAVADPGLKEWTIAVTGAAIALEVAFWTTAAMLGITIVQSRKAVFGFLTRPFRREGR